MMKANGKYIENKRRSLYAAGLAGKGVTVILAALMLLSTSCVRRDLEEYPGEGYVSIKIDWAGSGAPSADHKVKLLFYDAEGKLFRAVDNVTTGYEGAFPKGEYSIVAHNEDMVNADWRNRDDLGTAETFALPKEFEFDHRPSQLQCLSVPSSVYVANEFQESEKLIVSDIDNVSLTVVPVDRLHHLKLRFHVSVPGTERIESLGGVLGGVSGSWIASTGSHEPTIAMAHEFKASEATRAEGGTGTYEWEAPVDLFGFVTPGDSERAHSLYVSLGLKDYGLLKADFDLTPTVADIQRKEGGLPREFTIEINLHVTKTGLSATVLPWDESGTGNGSPRPQKQ